MASQRPEPRKKLSKVKQACDCCRGKKIRCDGEDPCANCQTTEMQCTYLAAPKKKGPKGPRTGKPPRKYKPRREEVIHGNIAPRIPPPLSLQCVKHRQLPVDDLFDKASRFQPSPMISADIMRRCVDAYFAHKYPVMPILDREQVYASLDSLDENPEQYGLITALCAIIALQPELLDPREPSENPADQLPSSETFVAASRRSRLYYNHMETPTLAAVHTSYFLFAVFFSVGRDSPAWFYISDAIAMLKFQRLHEEDTYSKMADPQHAAYCRRTFWLLFITERAYALQRHRPLTLQRSINLPAASTGPEATILSGFLDLLSLFQNFDDTFLTLWNFSSENSMISPESLIRLQNVLKFALLDISDRTEMQQADLLVSREWLKMMVWQLCVTRRLLSSSTTNESMSFQYPFTLARNVVLVSQFLPAEAFEANGVGILEKVFDIGWSVADILSLQHSRMQVSSFEIGPRDYLMGLLNMLGTCFGGNSKFLGLLAAKAEECLQVNIKRSLSENETSNKVVVIEEINDDEENNGRQGDRETFHDPSSAVEIQDDEVIVDIPDRDLPEEHFSLTSLSSMNLVNEVYPIPFSLSIRDGNPRGGFDGH